MLRVGARWRPVVKRTPSGIDPAVGDEGGKAYLAAVAPGGVVLQCVQMTWLLEKVDALTR